MIELPEVVTIARQMNESLRGKRVESSNRGNSPHKWVFYNHPPEDFAHLPVGKRVGEARAEGNRITLPLRPGLALSVGDMGGRILLHPQGQALPAKYHLLLAFEDHTHLTVAVQGWGFIQLLTQSDLAARPPARGLCPLSDAFTYARFKQMLADYEGKEKESVKKFIISGPAVSGIGNGCLQDILFRARIHPTRKVAGITAREARRLHTAIRKTIQQAVEAGGRDTERDLYGQPGGYRATLDRRAKGKPCPECGTPIEKIQYLGGASYFCPHCQPA